MTYRNDHDAAIARIDILTRELERAEADRSRLRAAIDQLRTGATSHHREQLDALELARAETAAERDRLVDNLRAGLPRRPRRRRAGHQAVSIVIAAVFVLALIGAASAHTRRHLTPPRRVAPTVTHPTLCPITLPLPD